MTEQQITVAAQACYDLCAAKVRTEPIPTLAEFEAEIRREAIPLPSDEKSPIRVTQGIREMLSIIESPESTEDEKTAAAVTIVEAVAPDIMEQIYGPGAADRRDTTEWMADLLEAALPDNMGGYPDLFWPRLDSTEGWEPWEELARQALDRYRQPNAPREDCELSVKHR